MYISLLLYIDFTTAKKVIINIPQNRLKRPQIDVPTIKNIKATTEHDRFLTQTLNVAMSTA